MNNFKVVFNHSWLLFIVGVGYLYTSFNIYIYNFLIAYRTVSMTRVTVRSQRTACVLHCLRTHMHVLLKGSSSTAGEMLLAVSSIFWHSNGETVKPP